MRYEEIVREFTNYIWYLQTHSKYKEPPKQLYIELSKSLTMEKYNTEKYNSCIYMRNILITLEEDANAMRHVSLIVRSGLLPYYNEFADILNNLNELIKEYNDYISDLNFQQKINKYITLLNTLYCDMLAECE